jgi:hypothetical protein
LIDGGFYWGNKRDEFEILPIKARIVSENAYDTNGHKEKAVNTERADEESASAFQFARVRTGFNQIIKHRKSSHAGAMRVQGTTCKRLDSV